jgi:PPOX class probable F420-dependent enzyme
MIEMAVDLSSDFGSRVANRLRDEQIAWLTTTSADGTPQPNPVWFLWNGEQILIFSQSDQAKLRNIQRNPHVSLNFNSNDQGGGIAIITGTAAFDPGGPSETEKANYQVKYADGIRSIGLSPESMLQTYSELIRLTPAKLRGF